MSIGIAPGIVPAPGLANSHSLGETRWVTYINPTTGVPEGMQKQIKLYNASGNTVAGGVYRVARSSTASQDPQVVDVTAQTVDQFYVVSPKIIADTTYGWFIMEGPCQALVDGDATDIAVGDYLKMTTATSANALTSDGTATLTADSIAIANEATTAAAALKKVTLLDSSRHDAD